MSSRAGEVVVIVGAGGGLGTSITQAFAQRGAKLILVGRTVAALEPLAQRFSNATAYAANLHDMESLERLRDQALALHGRVDVVINATGTDVRKPFLKHDLADIDRLLNTNLRGAIWLTRAFAPVMVQQKAGMIVHLGGFADGRLAFPFYSADVATRAGVRAFAESVNRELAPSGVTVGYFCPAAADTESERPFHPIWREMGVQIATPAQVANNLVKMVERRQPVYVMGLDARIFSALNAVWPRVADWLILNRYRKILARHLDPSTTLG